MTILIPIIHGAICSSGLYLCDKWLFKKDRSFAFYAAVFALVFGINFANKCHSKEFIPDASVEISNFKHEASLTPEQRSYYFAKAEKYIKDAHHCLNKAKELTVYIPDYHDKEYVKTQLRYLFMALMSADKRSVLVFDALETILIYFEGVIEKWEYVHTKTRDCPLISLWG